MMTRNRFTKERMDAWSDEINELATIAAKKFKLEIHSDWWQSHPGRGERNYSPMSPITIKYNLKLCHSHDYPDVYDGLFQVKVIVTFQVWQKTEDDPSIQRSDYCWSIEGFNIISERDEVFHEDMLHSYLYNMRKRALKTIETLDKMGV